MPTLTFSPPLEGCEQPESRRVVTEEIRDYPSKMSMNTACGLVGIPCVHLKAFLAIESIPF